MSWRVAAVFFTLGLISRLPFQTENLWAHDSVLYARAIERFDPMDQRPQAPGYLYYILLLRAVFALTGDANRAMTLVSLVAGAAAVALLYLLAARLYDERTGRASAAFLLTAVTFWAYGGVAYPYTLLAALSIGCALLFWRAITVTGSRGTALVVASIAYGIAIGFRTDLAIFLAPLWLLAAWSTPLVWSFASGAGVVALVVFWLFASGSNDGGLARFLEAQRIQVKFVEDRYSVFGNNGVRAVLGNAYELARFLGRGLYLLIPAVAVAALSADARRVELRDRRRAAFLVLWTFTPLVIYLPIHVGEYGYVFSMIPGLCLIAARGVVALARGARMPRAFPWLVAGVALANAATFLLSDTPLSARDVIRRDRGIAEKITRLEQPDLANATIIAAYDALIVEHYQLADHRLSTLGRYPYDPAEPPRVLTVATQLRCPPGSGPFTPPSSCAPTEAVIVVWDDIIRVQGNGWEEIVLPHGARLRVARRADGSRVIMNGLTVEIAR